jgi:hypothetical protein
VELLTVIPSKTKVKLHEHTDAVVIGAIIRDFGVEQYQVAWMSGNDRKSEWVWPHEIEVDSSVERQTIGFSPCFPKTS